VDYAFSSACLKKSRNFWNACASDATACAFVAYQAAQPSHFWRRELFKDYGLFNECWRYVFDHEFYLRLLLGGERCDALSYPLSAYRLHPRSATVSRPELSALSSNLCAVSICRFSLRLASAKKWRAVWNRVRVTLFSVRIAWMQGKRREAIQQLARLLIRCTYGFGCLAFKGLQSFSEDLLKINLSDAYESVWRTN
jgi:hypothetical protein